MASLINARDIASAWLAGMDHLIKAGGKAINLAICISPDGTEDSRIRHVLDSFLNAHESPQVREIKKVANTIFPSDFYVHGPGQHAREHFYEMQRFARQIEKRHLPRGTYIDRLIDWPADPAPVNQLERKIKALSRSLEKGRLNGNAYELALVGSEEFRDLSTDLRIQDPVLDKDKAVPGFPCLSHISLSLSAGQVHMTALYRNQYFLTKAYGNYLGLHNLLLFINAESGFTPGELLCVSTHADGEFGKNGFYKKDLVELVSACRAAAPAEV